MKNLQILFSAFILAAFMFGCNDQSADVIPASDANLVLDQNQTVSETVLGDELTASIVFLREEEKLARDVYVKLNETLNAQVFTNISASEQTHMDAVLTLLNNYQIEDPILDNTTGAFQNEDLLELYKTLIAVGSESTVASYQVGAAIEEIDILDIQNLLTLAVGHDDVVLTFDNLMRGSRNHLRAFVKNLSNLGVTYEPQYLSEEVYLSIVGTDMERGN